MLEIQRRAEAIQGNANPCRMAGSSYDVIFAAPLGIHRRQNSHASCPPAIQCMRTAYVRHRENSMEPRVSDRGTTLCRPGQDRAKIGFQLPIDALAVLSRSA